MRTPSFWSFIKNDKYCVGCTGQTVYVYSADGTELAKFKDLKYAYTAAFSPKGDIFVVKSAEGRLAIYSLSNLSLIKKFRFSKIDASQDDSFCFSPDGELFLNIERHKQDYISVLSIYSTADFSLVGRYFEEDDTLVPNTIEYGIKTGEYYILGYERPENIEYLSELRHFIARFSDGILCDKFYITEKEEEFYYWYKECEAGGFTQKRLQWTPLANRGYNVEKLKSQKLSLEGLWTYYNEKE